MTSCGSSLRNPINQSAMPILASKVKEPREESEDEEEVAVGEKRSPPKKRPMMGSQLKKSKPEAKVIYKDDYEDDDDGEDYDDDEDGDSGSDFSVSNPKPLLRSPFHTERDSQRFSQRRLAHCRLLPTHGHTRTGLRPPDKLNPNAGSVSQMSSDSDDEEYGGRGKGKKKRKGRKVAASDGDDSDDEDFE